MPEPQITSSRYPSLVRFRCPSELNAALDAAARRHSQTTSEFLRQLVLRELRKDAGRLLAGKPEGNA